MVDGIRKIQTTTNGLATVTDISAMEKECANACLRKHMAIFNDLQKPVNN